MILNSISNTILIATETLARLDISVYSVATDEVSGFLFSHKEI